MSGQDSRLRLVLFGVTVLLGGMLFPFRSSLSVLNFQLVLIPLSLLYLLAVLYFFYSKPLSGKLPDWLTKTDFSSSVLFWTLTTFSLAGIFMLAYENRIFGQFGYSISYLNLGVLFFFILLSASVLRFSNRGKYLPYALIISIIAIHMASILSFPLHPERSDMLLLIQAASQKLITGVNPYVNYEIFNPVMLTYLPDLRLSYLPAAFLNTDLRIINLILLAVAAVCFIRSAEDSQKTRYSIYATVFFLNPWLTFRHDIYLPVFIFQIMLVFNMYLKNKITASMIAFGWVLASYQFSWIIFPLYLFLLKRKFGMRTAVKAFLVAGTGFILLVLPFIIWSPSGFYEGVFGSWKTVFQVETFNFSYWITRVLPVQYLKLFQILCMLGFYLAALPKLKDNSRFFMFSTFITLLFMMTGQLIWHYFFLMPPIYMLYYIRILSAEN